MAAAGEAHEHARARRRRRPACPGWRPPPRPSCRRRGRPAPAPGRGAVGDGVALGGGDAARVVERAARPVAASRRPSAAAIVQRQAEPLEQLAPARRGRGQNRDRASRGFRGRHRRGFLPREQPSRPTSRERGHACSRRLSFIAAARAGGGLRPRDRPHQRPRRRGRPRPPRRDRRARRSSIRAAGATDVPAEPGGRDGPVPGGRHAGGSAGWWSARRAGAGSRVSAADVACAPGDRGACYTRSVRRAAAGRARAAGVELGAGAVDGTGAPVSARGSSAPSTRRPLPDVTPPDARHVTISAAGPCLAVTLHDRRAGRARSSSPRATSTVDTPAGAGATSFDVGVPLGGLPPTSVGDRRRCAPSIWPETPPSRRRSPGSTPAALPPVAITEVLANPLGPEPRRSGSSCATWAATTSRSRGSARRQPGRATTCPRRRWRPGGYALVVTSTYDPENGADPPPRAGTQLLRVDGRLGADGLSNGGEVGAPPAGRRRRVELRRLGRRVGRTLGRHSVHRLVETACDSSDAWNHTPLPPTPGCGPPVKRRAGPDKSSGKKWLVRGRA